jgi:hypothetical protein
MRMQSFSILAGCLEGGRASIEITKPRRVIRLVVHFHKIEKARTISLLATLKQPEDIVSDDKIFPPKLIIHVEGAFTVMNTLMLNVTVDEHFNFVCRFVPRDDIQIRINIYFKLLCYGS